MMPKILEIEKIVETNYYITTNQDLFPMYRRSESGVWERLMGESWESFYDVKELESLFLSARIEQLEKDEANT
jgi:hypothetical protein